MSHRFTKTMIDYAPGQRRLLESRIEDHQRRFGGRKPDRLLMHEHTLRKLIEEMAVAMGIEPGKLPNVSNIVGASFDGIPLHVCDCGHHLAPDLMYCLDGTTEEI